MNRRHFLLWTAVVAGARLRPLLAAESAGIAPQPYFAAVSRALKALGKLGAPIAAADSKQIDTLAGKSDDAAVVAAEKILDRYTLVRVDVGPDGYARASAGGAQRTLIEQGWQMFLVRVANPAGRTENLVLTGGMTPGRMTFSSLRLSQRAYLFDTLNKAPLLEKMWLMSQLDDTAALSGFAVEYRAIQVFSRDRGRRSGDFMFSALSHNGFAGWGVNLGFDCLPSRDITLGVLDTDGTGCVAAFTIKDSVGRVYPPQAMRIAPDMAFHAHVYRADGETVRLPDGEYTVESRRGPEYLRGIQTVRIGGESDRIDVRLKRWIDPSKWGWYSGDTHIHAAGCSHYESPTEGVSPETMIRHVRGEALSIGEVLTWGPGWYYQKQFFTGRAAGPPAAMEHPQLQAANNASLRPQRTAKDSESLLRYDVEVSGFPSSHAGHLILLRLAQQDYPGTALIEDWPSWNLPILRWGRDQGAVVGYAHCGFGMAVDSTALPNYEIPRFDSIGTNEAIVDVTHGAVDFLSGCEKLPASELNAWYHLLNCGFRLAMLGETDYPCIFDERPGVGRSYVRLDRRPVDDAGYNAWVDNLRKGRLYCGDGRSHFLEFTVAGRASGDESVVLQAEDTVEVKATVAAWLEPEPTPESEAIRKLPAAAAPSWHVERARIGNTREVLVELVSNGVAVDQATIIADGTPRLVHFKLAIARSSWVALRVMPSGHTHPVFVHVRGRPVRASKRSAQWCRACVDKLWDIKSPLMRENERAAAARAFDHARAAYDDILSECEIA